jgi:hypothetical protein
VHDSRVAPLCRRATKQKKNDKSHWYLSDSKKNSPTRHWNAIHGYLVDVCYDDAIMMSSADRLLCLRCSLRPVLGAPVGE